MSWECLGRRVWFHFWFVKGASAWRPVAATNPNTRQMANNKWMLLLLLLLLLHGNNVWAKRKPWTEILRIDGNIKYGTTIKTEREVPLSLSIWLDSLDHESETIVTVSLEYSVSVVADSVCVVHELENPPTVLFEKGFGNWGQLPNNREVGQRRRAARRHETDQLTPPFSLLLTGKEKKTRKNKKMKRKPRRKKKAQH